VMMQREEEDDNNGRHLLLWSFCSEKGDNILLSSPFYFYLSSFIIFN
jgi:hypothetical protein